MSEGIAANKALLDFTIPMSMGIEKSLEDGVLELKDSLNFISVIPTIPGVIGALPNLFKEWADLSEDEQKVLFGYAQAKFDLANDKLEMIVENGYNMALSLIKTIAAIRASRQASLAAQTIDVEGVPA